MNVSRRRPTIADVARAAGVSPAAVSFAVNDRPGVSPETRERILRAARELGWRPSAHARALTEARARAVGLVMVRDPAQLEADAFFVRFLSGIERTLAPHDYALLLQLLPAAGAGAGAGAGGARAGARAGAAGAVLGAYERLAAAGRVDGFLLTDVEVDDPRFELMEAAALPVVLAGRPKGRSAFPWVETDHGAGIEAAVRHLAELGHERIAFLGGSPGYEFVQERLARWQTALDAAGIEPGPVAHADAEEAAPVATRLLADPPCAIVCTSDALAMVVVATARERGLTVPGDVSVTGFDDSALAALASPPLTSVRVDYAEFGSAAAAALLATIGGEEPPGYRPSSPELIVRASTAAPRR